MHTRVILLNAYTCDSVKCMCVFLLNAYMCDSLWAYGVVVSMFDFHHSDRGSKPGRGGKIL